MLIFKRLIEMKDGTLSDDQSNPLFNEYSANFFFLESVVSDAGIEHDAEIDVVLRANRAVTAALPDGRTFRNG